MRPSKSLPKEKDIIRSLKNLAKKASSIVIATDFDREGELIGADALGCVKEVNAEAPVSRARYSAITKEEINNAFSNLVELDENLASAGESRQEIDLIWGAVLTRYLTIVKFAGYGNVRRLGPRANAHAGAYRGTRTRAHGLRARRLLGHQGGVRPRRAGF